MRWNLIESRPATGGSISLADRRSRRYGRRTPPLQVDEQSHRPTELKGGGMRVKTDDHVVTDREVTFGREEIIVSKTDLQGRITYANDVFCRVAGYTEEELLGQPHSIIRHPDMPRGVFALLWDTLHADQEIFAYVKNRTKTGDYYWVLANVTPTHDPLGRVIGYHSSRRRPDEAAIAQVIPLYQQMLDAERGLTGRKAADASVAVLRDLLESQRCTYEHLVWSLIVRETV